ncbi:MAG TPA: sugar ABC transporter substrate-binding protein [Polyangiaceae bacterium]|nr:sugar ABC transporter substrate-binding protein [Polyangiaceae bacterium]
MAERWVGLFLHDRLNDYQALLLADAQQAAVRHGLRLVVESADKEADRQVRQIRDALALPAGEQPALILVSPVRDTELLPLVTQAARQGVSWAFLTRWLDEIPVLRKVNPKVDVYSVSADQTEIGRIQARQLLLITRPGDSWLYLSGPLGASSARARAEGLRVELQGNPTRWDTLYSDWSEVGGRNAVTKWLDPSRARNASRLVLIAQNDDMAAGGRAAVEQWGQGHGTGTAELRVLGCDGSVKRGQRLVSEGRLTATIVVPPVSGRAIEEHAIAARGGRRPEARVIVPVRPWPDLDALRLKYNGIRF